MLAPPFKVLISRSSLLQSAVDSITRGRTAQRACQPLIAATLQALSALLGALHDSGPLSLHVASAIEILANADMVGLLLNSVFANSASSAASRAAAASTFSQLCQLHALLSCAVDDDVVASAPYGRERGGQGAAGAGGAGMLPAVGTCSVKASEQSRALVDMQPGLCALLQALVRSVGMPQQHVEPGQAQGRHVLRTSLTTLRTICQAVPSKTWSRCAHVSDEY